MKKEIKKETKFYRLILEDGSNIELNSKFTDNFSEKLSPDQLNDIIISTYNSLNAVVKAVRVEVIDPVTNKLKDKIEQNLKKIHELFHECEEISDKTGLSFKLEYNDLDQFSWAINKTYIPMPEWFSSTEECELREDYGWKIND